MQLSEAIALIDYDSTHPLLKSRWADLGCGSGLFTRALASSLPSESIIYAVDTDRSDLRKIIDYQDITIKTECFDFIRDECPFTNLDGILMANSLHYVKDKEIFLQKAVHHLNEFGSFLIVEYDTEIANQWVPYPISFSSLNYLFEKAGYTSVEKLNERPSIYRQANLYSAYISK